MPTPSELSSLPADAVAPALVTPPVAPVELPPEAPEPEPKIEVGLESVALIVAEPAPGIRRYINGVTDDGRVLACDTREAAQPMNPHRAKALIKAVRKAFPNAEIQLILA